MTRDNSNQPGFSPVLLWRVYFGLLIVLGLITLALIFQSRSESGIILGLSSIRLVIVAVISGLLVAAAWSLAESWRKPQYCSAKIDRLVSKLAKPGRWATWMLLMGLGLALGSYLLTLLPDLEEIHGARF